MKSCLLLFFTLCFCNASSWAQNIPPHAAQQSAPTKDSTAQQNINWTFFEGKIVNSRVQLQWATDGKDSTAYFELQKSSDGKTWQEAQRVKAATKPINYQTTDESAMAGNCWYRLAAVNSVGSSVFSKTIWVPGSRPLVQLLVNKTAGNVTLVWWGTTPVVAAVQVYNFNGVRVKDFGTFNLSGNYTLPLIDIAPGQYILKFAAGPVAESLPFQF